MAYNSRKLVEENADQWKKIVEADPSVHGSLQLKRVAVVLGRQALEKRCRAWADQALAIYEELGKCPTSVDGDGACGAFSLHVVTTLKTSVSEEDKAAVRIKIIQKARELCAPESLTFPTYTNSYLLLEGFDSLPDTASEATQVRPSARLGCRGRHLVDTSWRHARCLRIWVALASFGDRCRIWILFWRHGRIT